MSLQRQLLIAVCILFLLLLLANLAVSVSNTRSYLQEQLAVQTQDTATSLGFNISQAAQAKDTATIETMINAIFDRGFYRRIDYSDLNGSMVVSRENPVVIEGVPDWFIHWLDLPQPLGEAEVVSGWYQLGKVSVVGHPGYAYRDLWRVFKEQLILFLLAAFVAYVLAALALRILLRPLKKVEQQAEAICRKDFSTQPDLPKTTELRRVVTAMNRMVRKVADMFQEQLMLSDSLYRQAHLDGVTGLPNRTEFNARVDAFLSSDQAGGSIAMVLVHLEYLARLNAREGREAGDACLQAVAAALNAQTAEVEGVIVSRRSGSDFCLFVPFLAQAEVEYWVGDLFNVLTNLQWSSASDGIEIFIGVSMGGAYANNTDLLAQADTALRQVQHQGPPAIGWYDQTTQSAGRGLDDWRRLLQDKLANAEIDFDLQPVFGRQGTLLHMEVLARLYIDGERRPAGMFLAMADRLNLTPAFDRLLLTRLCERFGEAASSPLCVNLSTLSIRDPAFMAWLGGFLQENPWLAPRLIFELNERAVQISETAVRQFIARVKALGCAVSLDHVGLNGAALHYLQTLGVFYLKVARRFIQDIDVRQDNQFFVRSLVHIAHSCDVLILAEGVESEACWEAGLSLGLDGGQGFAKGAPQPVQNDAP